MASVSAASLLAGLCGGLKVGIVEEPVCIAGCHLVLRSLESPEIVRINRDVEELKDQEYLMAFMARHVAFALCEVDGVDLRDVQFIEDTVRDEATGQEKTVLVEKPDWLEKNVLSTWSNEALNTAYRKLLDVFQKSENKATEQVKFDVTEERSEDKARRLLHEVASAFQEIPDSLVKSILGEHGLMTKATQEELESVKERAREFALERAQRKVQETPATPSEDVSTPPSPPALAIQKTPPEPVTDQRVPLSIRMTKEQAKPVAAPAQLKQNASPARAPANLSPRRAAQIQDEIDALSSFPVDDAVAIPTVDADQIPEVKKSTPVDIKQVRPILDQPPARGINPRFRSPLR